MNAVALLYIVGGGLMCVFAAIPSRSSALTRIGAALFGIGAVLAGIVRLQQFETPVTYGASAILLIGGVIYVIGSFRDRKVK